MPTATLVRSDLKDFTGTANLYRLDPPLDVEDWDGKPTGTTYDYVIVSATVAMFGGPETYIFGSDEQGEIASWTELQGSYQGGLNHEEALNGAGYEVA